MFTLFVGIVIGAFLATIVAVTVAVVELSD